MGHDIDAFCNTRRDIHMEKTAISETFFIKSVLLKPEILDFRPVALEKKR